MLSRVKRLSTPLAAAVAAFALAVPASSSAYRAEDLRSSDTQYGADAASQSSRDAQRAEPGYQDLRSPDTRDAASDVPRGATTEPPPAPEVATDGGFDWGDAGIGAGSAVGLVLVALSVMVAVVHRRGRGARRRAVTS